MRFVEFTNGIKTYVSGEEQDLLKHIDENNSVLKKDLTERQQLLASRLTGKSILIRQKNGDQTEYKLSNSAEYTAPY